MAIRQETSIPEAEIPYRNLLRDLSRMAEPALVTHLKGQLTVLSEALGLRKGDILASISLEAGWNMFEMYGLNQALCAVLFDNNPNGYITVSPSEYGTMRVSGENQAELFLIPNEKYPFINLDLKHEDEHRRRD